MELINGEIVQRPAPRGEHGTVQNCVGIELGQSVKRDGPGGWWISTEQSVRYTEHECPTHDLAGWCKETCPKRPSGVMTLRPDWVCEITSPGHESKDYIKMFLLLKQQSVPHYWIICPEEKSLIAYTLEDGHYKENAVIRVADTECKLAIPPFSDLQIDLSFVFRGIGE